MELIRWDVQAAVGDAFYFLFESPKTDEEFYDNPMLFTVSAPVELPPL